jgi:glutathionylspermidine synthase
MPIPLLEWVNGPTTSMRDVGYVIWEDGMLVEEKRRQQETIFKSYIHETVMNIMTELLHCVGSCMRTREYH